MAESSPQFISLGIYKQDTGLGGIHVRTSTTCQDFEQGDAFTSKPVVFDLVQNSMEEKIRLIGSQNEIHVDEALARPAVYDKHINSQLLSCPPQGRNGEELRFCFRKYPSSPPTPSNSAEKSCQDQITPFPHLLTTPKASDKVVAVAFIKAEPKLIYLEIMAGMTNSHQATLVCDYREAGIFVCSIFPPVLGAKLSKTQSLVSREETSRPLKSMSPITQNYAQSKLRDGCRHFAIPLRAVLDIGREQKLGWR